MASGIIFWPPGHCADIGAMYRNEDPDRLAVTMFRVQYDHAARRALLTCSWEPAKASEGFEERLREKAIAYLRDQHDEAALLAEEVGNATHNNGFDIASNHRMRVLTFSF